MEAHVPLQIAVPALVDGLGAHVVKVCDNEHVVYEDVACIFYIPVSISQSIILMNKNERGRIGKCPNI